MTQQPSTVNIPKTWVSPRAKLVYHPPMPPHNRESWGVALHEACNCHESDHQEHWNYEGNTKETFEEAVDHLKTFWWTSYSS